MIVIRTRSRKGYLQATSGLFSTKEHPGGLTPKELNVLAALLFVMEDESAEVDATTKAKVASLLNHPTQVITNYVKKLRDKGAITPSNKIHKIIQDGEITIKHKEDEDNLQSRGDE
jgi:hypothetical protein